jgi:hypothetical protein
METLNNTTEKSGIIVAFHTGRGGRFYNAGHTTFIGEKKISEFTDSLFIRFENEQEVIGKFSNEQVSNAVAEAIHEEDFETLAKFGIAKSNLGNQEYFDGVGSPVGLTVNEANEGVGCINIDNEYDTTCACYIEDCSDEQIEMIIAYHGYKSYELENWIAEHYPELIEEEE